MTADGDAPARTASLRAGDVAFFAFLLLCVVAFAAACTGRRSPTPPPRRA